MSNNIFNDRLATSCLFGNPHLACNDISGMGCGITLAGGNINHGTYNYSIPVLELVDSAVSLSVGNASTGWLNTTGTHTGQLVVTSGNIITLVISGEEPSGRIDLQHVAVSPA